MVSRRLQWRYSYYVVFENVTYIKCSSSDTNSLIDANFYGITQAELNAGKTLTNDVTITSYD